VKGKTAPERIFALLGDDALRITPRFRELAAANAEMRAAYAAQDWAAVRPLLDRIEELAGALGLDLAGYVALYRDRVATFLAAPPLENWDGVYAAETK
jgi:adenylate cyclase